MKLNILIKIFNMIMTYYIHLIIILGRYRDIHLSDMYLVDDITQEILVPVEEVPSFQPTTANKRDFEQAYLPGMANKPAQFKRLHKSDFALTSLLPKKARLASDYERAKVRCVEMLGKSDEDQGNDPRSYILRCVVTDCSPYSLYQALDYYSVEMINKILSEDFNYSDLLVVKSKSNLLLVCEGVLNQLNSI